MIAGVVVLGGIYLLKTEKIQYTQNEPTVIEKEVEVDALDNAIKTAQNAKMLEIEATATAAYNAAYEQEMKKVELQVIQDFNAKLDARQIELEKQTKVY